MSDYDTDVVVWADCQSALLRRIALGEPINDQVDWPNIIEEIEAVGRAERAALRRYIGTVIEHLIWLQACKAIEPRRGWTESIIRARSDIEQNLDDNPSLRPAVSALIAHETPLERELVVALLKIEGKKPCVDIDSLTFTEDQVLGDWWPPTP